MEINHSENVTLRNVKVFPEKGEALVTKAVSNLSVE